MDSSSDEFYMQRCLQLAKLGAGHVAPNPMVGAVLVHRGRIIGEGYHQLFGFAHAEVNCVNAVPAEDQHLIPAATMYVSLEPCAHHGKTPPCADLIVSRGIREVVIGCVDTFSAVSGKGIAILKNAGITVRTGILEKECRELNKRFFTYHEQQRPYIILKWAQDPAGYMASADGAPVRISNAFTDRLVHRWRSEEMSIMVGTNAAVNDNPRLNNRLWTGNSPVRVVIDRTLRTPPHFHLWQDDIPTLFFTAAAPVKEGLVQINFDAPVLPQVLQELYQRKIQSVIVEGGAYLLNSCIAANAWDEARVITGLHDIPEGQPAPVLPHTLLTAEMQLEGDRILYYTNKP